MMDIEAGKPMMFDTIFSIASMTKPFTSVGVIQLYKQGYFNLNTPIYKFIPGFRDAYVLVKENERGIELEELIYQSIVA